MIKIKIGKKIISEVSKTYFIADIAANHDGNLNRAKKLIKLAAENGADAAKFQHFKADTIVSKYQFDKMKKTTHQSNWKKSVYQVYKDASINNNWNEILTEECKKNNVACILAGGGKSRVLKFITKGLTTWLNGSTMFCPKVIDLIYSAIMRNQTDTINYYIENIEKPFFNDVVNRYGWHISHKAALEFFGYGKRYERFPHPSLSSEDYNRAVLTFNKIKIALEKII